jgi:hypothetical protein
MRADSPNRYTHASRDNGDRLRAAFVGFSLTPDAAEDPGKGEEPLAGGSDLR